MLYCSACTNAVLLFGTAVLLLFACTAAIVLCMHCFPTVFCMHCCHSALHALLPYCFLHALLFTNVFENCQKADAEKENTKTYERGACSTTRISTSSKQRTVYNDIRERGMQHHVHIHIKQAIRSMYAIHHLHITSEGSRNTPYARHDTRTHTHTHTHTHTGAAFLLL